LMDVRDGPPPVVQSELLRCAEPLARTDVDYALTFGQIGACATMEMMGKGRPRCTSSLVFPAGYPPSFSMRWFGTLKPPILQNPSELGYFGGRMKVER